MIWVPIRRSSSCSRIALSSAAAALGEAGLSLVRMARRASGRSAARLLGQALDSGTAGDQPIERAAGRAVVELGAAVAAVVAEQAPAQAMVDQPGAAVRAAQPMAAGPAQGERRKAAPIEEQERLLAGGERVDRAPRAGSARASRRAADGRAAGRSARPRAWRCRRGAPAAAARSRPAASAAAPPIRPIRQAVSSEGVAETRIAGHPSRRARASAMSRPW